MNLDRRRKWLDDAQDLLTECGKRRGRMHIAEESGQRLEPRIECSHVAKTAIVGTKRGVGGRECCHRDQCDARQLRSVIHDDDTASQEPAHGAKPQRATSRFLLCLRGRIHEAACRGRARAANIPVGTMAVCHRGVGMRRPPNTHGACRRRIVEMPPGGRRIVKSVESGVFYSLWQLTQLGTVIEP